MDKAVLILALIFISACNGSSPRGYEWECMGADTNAATCNKELVPTAIDFGDSVSLGFSGRTRYNLYGSVDFRHDSWDNEGITPVNRSWYYGEVVSRGQNDGNSNQLLSAMESHLNDRYYTVLLYNSGVHDATFSNSTGLPHVSLSEYRLNMEAVAQEAEQHASIVVWVASTPIPAGAKRHSGEPLGVPGSEREYNAIGDQIANEHGFYILHLDSKGQIPHNVHYTGPGYDYLGKQVSDCILTALSNQDTDNCHR